MNDISETRITRLTQPDMAMVMRPVNEAELAPYWPLAARVRQFLTEHERQYTLASPAAALRAPEPIPGEPSLITGLYAATKKRERLIGLGYIHLPDRYPGIGQYILDPEAIGKGFGSLIIHGLTRHITEAMGKPLVQATTLTVNRPSLGSLEAAGFIKAPLSGEVCPYGADGRQSPSQMCLLFRPNTGYVLPPGKFRGPDPALIERSKQLYIERTDLFGIDR